MKFVAASPMASRAVQLLFLACVFFVSFLTHASGSNAAELPFNEVHIAILANGIPGDRYTFEGIAGDEVTVSAYFGRSRIPGSLLFPGRLRLMNPGGTVIAEPPLEEIQKVYCDPCLTDGASFSRIDRFILPESGTYTVEIRSVNPGGRGGKYWLAVSNPRPPASLLTVSTTKEGTFSVRGDHQHLIFHGDAGKSYGWSYAGVRSFEQWEVQGPQNLKQGSGAPRTSIITRSNGNGDHHIFLKDRKGEPITDPGDIGPFAYTLTPAKPADLNAVKVYVLNDKQDADLFTIEGKAGMPLSVTAFFGGSKSNDLGGFGSLRLLSPTGDPMEIPAMKSVKVGSCGATCTENSVYSVHIDRLILPEDGTYFLEITSEKNNPGNYWLGIAGTGTSATLPLTLTAGGSFRVRGDTHTWTFFLAQGQKASWSYSGLANVRDWRIVDVNDVTVASGPAGAEPTISITAPKSGTYRLILEDNAVFIPTNSEGIGSFPYILFPDPKNTEPPTRLERFSPILHIFKDDFRPKEIESILQESTLEPLIGSPIDRPTQNDLATRNSDLSLEDALNMSGAVAGFSPVVPPVDRFEKYQTAIYGREFTDVAEEGEITNLPLLTLGKEYTILQYWFFYPYNNFVWRHTDGTDRPGNNHEGDWEMIQIILDGEDPVYATYSWHWAGTTFTWDELQVDGEHPHVYVGKGGHANWERGGVRFYNLFEFPRGDITPEEANASAENFQINKVECDFCQKYALLKFPQTNSWSDFTGHWGELGDVEGLHGPSSPPYISYGVFSPILRWSLPISWSNSPVPFLWSAQANSPVNLSVKDSAGNVVGVHPDGSVSATIPGVYEFVPSNNGPEYVTILTNSDLTFVLEGTGIGTMDFFISQFGAGGAFNLSYEDVPITTSFYAELPTGSSNPENALFVDTNGDGIFDLKFLPGVMDPISLNSPLSIDKLEEVSTNNGGGRRGSPGRGGSAVAADSSLHRLITAIPPSLVVTGPREEGEEIQPEEDLSFSFIDVPPDAPYAHALYELVKRGIVSGYEDERGNQLYYFYPDRPITIAEFSKMLCKALGLPWDDVLPRTLSAQNDHWAYGYIARLELNGLAVFHDPLIQIDSPISRVQFKSMLDELDVSDVVSPDSENLSRAEAALLLFSMLK